jgi:hypothetical protein
MSIYRRPRAIADNDVTAPVIPDAENGLARPRVPPAGGNGFQNLRKSNPAAVLLPHGRRWMASLPADVRPAKSAERFPRIVNLLALEWANDAGIGALFTSLLIDQRGGRKGFPAEIVRELRVLRDYRYHPTGR